jgi:hypothetical protein
VQLDLVAVFVDHEPYCDHCIAASPVGPAVITGAAQRKRDVRGRNAQRANATRSKRGRNAQPVRARVMSL